VSSRDRGRSSSLSTTPVGNGRPSRVRWLGTASFFGVWDAGRGSRPTTFQDVERHDVTLLLSRGGLRYQSNKKEPNPGRADRAPSVAASEAG